MGRSDDVDDAIQDTFCKLWGQRDSISGESHAEALTIVTLRNTCIDTVRRSSTMYIPLDTAPQLAAEDDNTDSDTADTYQRVMTIIQRELPLVQRRIINMRDVEGLPYSEIAQALNMEESTVRVNLSRARKTVREIYRKYENH